MKTPNASAHIQNQKTTLRTQDRAQKHRGLSMNMSVEDAHQKGQ